MAGLTIMIPDDLFARLQADGTMQATSADALVQSLVEGHVTRAECALPGNYEILLQVALGQTSVDTTVRQLHLEGKDDLFILLSYAGLSRPRISQAGEAQMRERLDVIAQ